MSKNEPCTDGVLIDLTALSTPEQILAVCTAVLLCGHISNKIAGICGNVAILIDEGFMYRSPFGLRGAVHSLFSDIATKWPSFSGDRQYPVPHSSMNPEDAYNELDLWENDEYGDTRRSLLEFVHSQALALAGGVAARDPYWLDSAIRLKG